MLKPLAITLAAAATLALTPTEPVDWPMVARIREEGLQRSRVMEFESYMVDVLGARLTMSRDMQRAQAWALETMRGLGLQRVAAEPYMDYGVTWDNEYVSLHLLQPDYTPMVGYPVAHTAGTPGKLVADVVIPDLLTRDEAAKLRGTLRGKAVLNSPMAAIDLATLTHGVPRYTPAQLDSLERIVVVPSRPPAVRAVPNPVLLTAVERMAFYKAEGVAVVLETGGNRIAYVPGFSRPGSRNDGWSAAGMRNSVPQVVVTPEHYNRMYRLVQRGMPVQVEVEVRNRIGDRVEQAVNLVGEIPGTDPSGEVVMLGAHFDTWHGSGNASDNTSGVAVALEAMRILQALGVKPRRTIRIALWSGEEQGLFGSRAYVREHFGDPRDPSVGRKPGYERLSAYFNQDYGAGQYRGIYLQGNEAARGMLTAWMQPFRDFGMTMVGNGSLGSTDHVAFDEVGLPGFQFLQDRTPGTGGHTNLDALETIQPEDLMKNAVVMASYVYHAAMAETLVPRKAWPATR
ncbi:MAG: M20/M25/M40 family metallo-hydrolase [Gemmatimonadaceae bacterium]|nr:M20/M25/M40 family metallo-hydrolase [Gemmatimonadaceae bacterium]